MFISPSYHILQLTCNIFYLSLRTYSTLFCFLTIAKILELNTVETIKLFFPKSQNPCFIALLGCYDTNDISIGFLTLHDFISHKKLISGPLTCVTLMLVRRQTHVLHFSLLSNFKDNAYTAKSMFASNSS